MSTQRPILFSTLMVHAILEGRKTQTRRTVKYPAKDGEHGWHPVNAGMEYRPGGSSRPSCPYGRRDHILWIRESWNTPVLFDGGEPEYVYKADGDIQKYASGKWKPSIHMPKAACRIFLQIKSVRVERLQDISEEEAIAEGIKFDSDSGYYFVGDIIMEQSAVDAFKKLWIHINGEESWNSNPWVWVVEFKKISKPKQ